MKKLTDKQEHFSQLVVKYGNQSKAYREAYDVSETTSDNVIHNEASKLMTNHDVTIRVTELRTDGKKTNKVDRDFIIQGYLEIINDTNHVFKLADLKDSDTDASNLSKYFYTCYSTTFFM